MIAAPPQSGDLRATSWEVKGELRSNVCFRRLGVSADPAGVTHISSAGWLGSALGLYSETAKPAVPSPAKIQSP